MNEQPKKERVIVTGFGPFGDHKVNISWEVAKTLKTLNLESHDVELILREIPVQYSFVTKEVPLLWKKFKPKLVVHMGLTSVGSEIALETTAHKNGYIKVDVTGKTPPLNSAIGKEDILHTAVNLREVADTITNSAEVNVPVEVSSNAGRYLCEFIFYTSLNIDYCKTIFIHLPNFDKGFTVLELAHTIKIVILLVLNQIIKLKNN